MLSNLEILCYVLGWQGGTLEQVVEALDYASINGVLNWPEIELPSWMMEQAKQIHIIQANKEGMRHLCRMAQEYVRLQRKREMSR